MQPEREIVSWVGDFLVKKHHTGADEIARRASVVSMCYVNGAVLTVFTYI